MADKKVEKKTAIIFFPLRLNENKNIIAFIQVYKDNEGVKYDIAELNKIDLRKYFDQLPGPAKSCLYNLSNEGILFLEDGIKKKFKHQKSGVLLKQFYLPAFIRKIQEQFEVLKPFAHLIKWYHHLPNPATGNMTTAACVFSIYKPVLQFEVVKEDTHLQLVTNISINNTQYNLHHFRRFHFLLESRNEYFLLTHKDYQTLEWLQENQPGQYSMDPVLFAQHILTKLEADYPLQRNNLFEITTIEVLPQPRVLLSEISNSFLMLTPQWIYDGYLVDGEWKDVFETSNNGEAIIIKRNKEKETAFKKQLEVLHPNFKSQYNGYYYLSFAEAQKKQWFLKVYHQLLEMD
ncbi:MAG TPA: hypothetical protein VLR49_15185, partial [Ferruginibacter sp.]|nr:hypothetical protein [Ferruginibacter sp.]